MKSPDIPSSGPQPGRLQLTQEQIEQINKALATIKEFGEVHLVVQRGALKYINVLNSHKADDLLSDQVEGE